MNSIIEVLSKALTAGGVILKEGYLSENTGFDKKGIVDVVTKWDLKSERAIRETIISAFPDHNILGEEEGAQGDMTSGYTWIIDPLDGTVNFVHRFPFFCVSIACQFEGNIFAAGIYAPIPEQTFLAEKDNGATLNGKSISVSDTKDLNDSLFVTGFSYERRQQRDKLLNLVGNAIDSVQGVRRTGSAAMDLAYTAAGIFDAYAEFGIHAWDIAAGSLLVTEAGGKVSKVNGDTLDVFGREILASNSQLHHKIIENVLKGV